MKNIHLKLFRASSWLILLVGFLSLIEPTYDTYSDTVWGALGLGMLVLSIWSLIMDNIENK